MSVPVGAVLAIYARETGQGMALPDEVAGDNEPAMSSDEAPGSNRPTLSAVPSESSDESRPPPEATSVDAGVAGDSDDDDPGNGPDRPEPRRGPHLRVVK